MNRRTFLQKGGLIGGAFLGGTPFLLKSAPLGIQPLFRVERVYVSMGTTVRFLVFHEDEREAVAAVHEAQTLVQDVHRLMSVQEPDSELSRWNRSETGVDVSFDPLTAQAIDEAFQYVQWTEGRFDPTVARTVEAAERGSAPIPLAERLSPWKVEEQCLMKVHPDVQLDLGGSAKGWAVDRATDILAKRGATAALVNAGGDLRVVGHPPGEPSWRIGIRSPIHTDDLLCELSLSDCSVATSGGYESDGSTIIDPRTGQRTPFGGTVTVIAPSCGAADCLSTAIFVEPDADLLPEHTHSLIGRFADNELVVKPSANFPSRFLVSDDPNTRLWSLPLLGN